MAEEWKAIKGYEGLYQVSNKGRIKSVQRNGTINGDRIIVPNCSGRYARIGLRNKEKKSYSVHRLVAEAFIPNPHGLPQVDHIDGNRYNNDVNNLRWTTAKQNRNNPITVNRHREAMKKLCSGENCKKVGQYTKEGIMLQWFTSTHEAERCTGISRSNIVAACKQKHIYASDHWATVRSAGGYIWKFL